ncbi:HAMP domain-containing sensor histidine kinase [Halorubellus sp. PRR65]|uniref:sensor histidine kinase n=1 Tax=Halorubellus sp. PRR65 TaxID=3098148 RepID=UPI002B260C6F|nr:HAMP domain-containing sensor histidine kinase [Halorubellus sp. PRR65]
MSRGEQAKGERYGVVALGLAGLAAVVVHAATSTAHLASVVADLFASTFVVSVLAFVALTAFGVHLARTETPTHCRRVAAVGVVTAVSYLALVAAFYAGIDQPFGGVADAFHVGYGIAAIGAWFGVVPTHFYLRQRRQTERLRELNAELRETNAELREQNERLDEFASILGHDLRNPLAVARGYVELAAETGNLDHLDNVNACHARIETLVDQVLALARMERDPDAVTELDVAGVATDAHETVDIGDGEVVVDVDCTVEAERSDLRQVFENCYRNAAEHAGPDPTIRVTCLDDDPGFAIADDGPGIPGCERDAVFERGYSNDDGTGLGLAIVAEVADTYDWTVDVVEAVDGGARFEFRTATTAADVDAPDERERPGPDSVDEDDPTPRVASGT